MTNKVWAKFILCIENFQEAGYFVERALPFAAYNVYYDFDLSCTVVSSERAGVTLPEEICDHLAVLRYGCENEVLLWNLPSLAWPTPEREARVTREIERSRQQDASVAV